VAPESADDDTEILILEENSGSGTLEAGEERSANQMPGDDEVLVIEEEINPAAFEVTAILRHLEIAGKYPLVPRRSEKQAKDEYNKLLKQYVKYIL